MIRILIMRIIVVMMGRRKSAPDLDDVPLAEWPTIQPYDYPFPYGYPYPYYYVKGDEIPRSHW